MDHTVHTVLLAFYVTHSLSVHFYLAAPLKVRSFSALDESDARFFSVQHCELGGLQPFSRFFVRPAVAGMLQRLETLKSGDMLLVQGPPGSF
jgi:hypothetical protein